MRISGSSILFFLKKIIILTILLFTAQPSLHGMELRNSVSSVFKKVSTQLLNYSIINAETSNREKLTKCLVYGAAGIAISAGYKKIIEPTVENYLYKPIFKPFMKYSAEKIQPYLNKVDIDFFKEINTVLDIKKIYILICLFSSK